MRDSCHDETLSHRICELEDEVQFLRHTIKQYQNVTAAIDACLDKYGVPYIYGDEEIPSAVLRIEALLKLRE